MSSCRFDSIPITVWCSSTWLRTEPSAYFVGVLFVTASSTASLIARPSDPEQSGSSASLFAAGVRVGARGRDDLRAPGLHHVPPVGLLVVAHPHHVDLHVDAEELAGEGERAAPLPGARLGGEALHALLLVVEGLRHRRVRLVAARGAHALVLVEDLRRRLERLLEPVGAVERRRAPQPVDVAHGLRDLDPALLRDLLLDEGHGEERRQVGRADRLLRARVQHGRQRRTAGRPGGCTRPSASRTRAGRTWSGRSRQHPRA